MSAEISDGNPRCLSECRKVNLCEKMRLRGVMWIMGGDPQIADELLGTSSLEQDIIDGVYTEEEGIRIATLAGPIADSQAEEMREAGKSLSGGAANLKRMLVEGCVEGPYVDGALNICRSEHSAAFMFSEEDLQ